jgi:hypothetical protein
MAGQPEYDARFFTSDQSIIINRQKPMQTILAFAHRVAIKQDLLVT